MVDLPRFALKPYRDGYGFNIGRNTVSTPTESGKTRQRLDRSGTPHRATATYKCTVTMYQYLTAFLRTYEAQTFLAYLLLDDVYHKWYECRCLDDNSISVTAQGDQIFLVQITLEVTPTAVSKDEDIAIVEAYSLTDGKPGIFLQLLEDLANNRLPD